MTKYSKRATWTMSTDDKATPRHSQATYCVQGLLAVKKFGVKNESPTVSQNRSEEISNKKSTNNLREVTAG